MIFDASSSYRYGVFCGELYFKISHSEVLSILVEKYGTELDDLFIAYRELLAALFPILAFAKNGRKKFVRVNSENINMVNPKIQFGVKKNRFFILSAIEYYKFKCGCGLKIKAYYIKSSVKTSADAISRGLTPKWFLFRGV